MHVPADDAAHVRGKARADRGMLGFFWQVVCALTNHSWRQFNITKLMAHFPAYEMAPPKRIWLVAVRLCDCVTTNGLGKKRSVDLSSKGAKRKSWLPENMGTYNGRLQAVGRPYWKSVTRQFAIGR